MINISLYDKRRKTEMSNNGDGDKRLIKYPAHSLPSIYGWHSKIPVVGNDKGGRFKHFGLNWWELLHKGKIGSKGSVVVNTKDSLSVVLVNLGPKMIEVTDDKSGDVYQLIPGKKKMATPHGKSMKLVSKDTETEFQYVFMYNVILVMVGLEKVREGKAKVMDSVVFSDFLLMSGIPNRTQYVNTVAIESMTKIDVEGDKVFHNETQRSTWSDFLEEHWEKVNPRMKGFAKQHIPFKIHWIWISPRKGVYGNVKPRFVKYMKTWIDRNPNCEYNLWTDNPHPELPKGLRELGIKIRGTKDIDSVLNKLPKNMQSGVKYLYRNHPNVGARSDTLRQAILYVVGGCYADVNDASCLVPLEKMFKKFDFMIGVEPVIYVNNAMIAAKKGHVVQKNFLMYLAKNSKDIVSHWVDEADELDQEARDDLIVTDTGPIAMTNVMVGLLDDSGIDKKMARSCIFPSSWIYPNYQIANEPARWIKPYSLTGHFDARDYLK